MNTYKYQTHDYNQPPTIETKDRPRCVICGSPGDLLYTRLRDQLFGVEGEFSYRCCGNIHCGLIWQDPMPIPEDLAKAYANYYTHGKEEEYHGMFGRRLARLPANLLNALFIRLLGIRKQRKAMRYLGLKESPPGQMLEIGCGRGERLSFFKSLGWEVTGQDIDKKAVAHAKAVRGVDVLCGELTSLSFESAQFDVIVMSHVLEHVPDIQEILSECFRLLQCGGRVIITTPNADSFGHKKFGGNWRGLEPPRHLHIFSKKNLQAVLHQNGFRQISVQANAANTRSVFEASYRLREGTLLQKEKYPTTAIYYKSLLLQYKEWLLSGRNSLVGEELFAQAYKQQVAPRELTVR